MPAKVAVQSDGLYIDVRLSGGVSSLTLNEAEQLKGELNAAIFEAKLYAASLETPEQHAKKVAALMAIIEPKQESEDNS